MVQIRVHGVRRLYQYTVGGRYVERALYMFPRLGVPWFGGAPIAFLFAAVLFGVGTVSFAQFLVMAIAAAIVGIALGYIQLPTLAEPSRLQEGKPDE